MNITLYNRSFLREHPDAPPWVDSSFMKNHSFMFPGDEVVLYNQINLPGDIENVYGTATMKDIQFNSVKMSIIAKKPNIFTSPFSSIFTATRSFVLDSATVNLNGKNAPVTSWCGDGYASNMNYQSPRNWKLPIDDFRRQINLFTTHTEGTPNWTYWFFFPIQYRWEYWKNLPQADNDFVNNNCGSRNGAVQNNKTQNWTNYAGNPDWQIVSRIELNLTVQGQSTTLISELVLNRETTSIQTYNNNPDYINKSIKMCTVGGIPVNTPNPVFSDSNTSIFAYLTKVSTWNLKEQGLITGFITIEVFEGAGQSQRLRASSSCAATPESCFVSLQNPILNDDGTPVLNNTNDPLLHDPQGVALTFNGQDIIMEAQIDFNKLNAAFPNAIGYNVTARLYNNSVYTD